MTLELNIFNLNNSIKSCNKCNLWKSKNNYVLGVGTFESDILFVGEAPGYNEDIKGIPFIGKAGKILDNLLLSIGLNREDVYITNILKCRPPNNRNPTKSEIEICTKYLDSEIELIEPKLISTLGSFSSKFIFDKFKINYTKISDIHGKIYPINSNYGKLHILPQYHPAFGVYNPNNIKILKKDFKNIRKILNKKNQISQTI